MVSELGWIIGAEPCTSRGVGNVAPSREDGDTASHDDPDCVRDRLCQPLLRPIRTSFTVSATVVAACAIAPRLPNHVCGAEVALPRIACATTPASPAIVAPQPVVTLTRDATGLTTVQIEF